MRRHRAPAAAGSAVLTLRPATDLDVVRVHGADVTVKFVHELRGAEDLRKAVLYARARVLQDAARLNCNVLLSEGCAFFPHPLPLTHSLIPAQVELHAHAPGPAAPRRGRVQRAARARPGHGHSRACARAAVPRRARPLRAAGRVLPGAAAPPAVPQLEPVVERERVASRGVRRRRPQHAVRSESQAAVSSQQSAIGIYLRVNKQCAVGLDVQCVLGTGSCIVPC